jgi:hypothetical protein
MWFDTELMYGPDDNDDIVGQELAEDFVDLSRGGLAHDGIPELALNHRESCLHVTARRSKH